MWKKLFGRKPQSLPAAEVPVTPPKWEVPSSLPKASPELSAGKFTEMGVLDNAKNPLPPETPLPETLSQLYNQQADGPAATQCLAAGLPPNEAVDWAAESANTVKGEMTEADLEALEAATAYLKDPSQATAKAAEKAASAAGHQGPGAWAAEAAGMAGVIGVGAAFAGPKIGMAVAGSVMLSAVLQRGDKIPPADQPVLPEQPDLPQASLAPPELSLPEPPAPPQVSAEEKMKENKALLPFLESGIQRLT